MNTPPRYALLWHDCPADYRDGPHWDLMLERPVVDQEHRLATWSLLALPAAWAEKLAVSGPDGEEPLIATELPDHRAAYLSYEGKIAGGRGTVTRLAGGAIEWTESQTDQVALRLIDGPLAGSLTLTRVAGESWHLRLL